jgi:hypothetical protein
VFDTSLGGSASAKVLVRVVRWAGVGRVGAFLPRDGGVEVEAGLLAVFQRHTPTHDLIIENVASRLRWSGLWVRIFNAWDVPRSNGRKSWNPGSSKRERPRPPTTSSPHDPNYNPRNAWFGHRTTEPLPIPPLPTDLEISGVPTCGVRLSEVWGAGMEVWMGANRWG